MATEIKLHPVQANILVSLLFTKELRFSQLPKGGISSDHFNFHLKSLLTEGLLEKTPVGKYSLTPKGKEFANRFDTKNLLIERQAKVGVLVICTRKINGKVEYLFQQRLKEPYYGFWGGVSGKIRWGEKVEEAAKRELQEETGLKGKPIFVGIEHKIDYSKAGELLEDKFFFVVKVTNPKGKLVKSFEGGKNHWLTEEQAFNSPNLFADIKDILSLVKGKEVKLIEKSYTEVKY